MINRNILIIFFLFSLFLIPKLVKAESISFSQSLAEQSSVYLIYPDVSCTHFIAQSFVAEDEDISKIEIDLASYTTITSPATYNNIPTMVLCEGELTTATTFPISYGRDHPCGNGHNLIGTYYDTLNINGSTDISDFIINETTTIGNDYYFILGSCNSGGGSSRTIYLYSSASDIYSGGDIFATNNGNISNHTFSNLNLDLTFSVYTSFDPPVPLIFTNPFLDTYLPITTTTSTYNFLGTCPTNGTDQLLFINTFEDNPDLCIQPDLVDFTVDCIDNEFSYTADIYLGHNSVGIYDKSYWVENSCYPDFNYFADINYIGYEPTDFNLWISSPYTSENNQSNYNYLLVQESENFPIQFSYTAIGDPTEIYLTMENTNNVFEVQGAPIIFDTLSNLDPNNLNYIWTDVTASSTEIFYYRASLSLQGDPGNFRVIYFAVDGSGGIDTPAPLEDDQQDYGFWGNIFRQSFVPRQSFLNKFTDLKQDIFKKIPLGYFTLFKQRLSGLGTLSTNENIELSFSIPPSVMGEENGTTTFSFMDTSLPTVANYADGLRPYFVYGLWLLLFYAIYQISTKLFD